MPLHIVPVKYEIDKEKIKKIAEEVYPLAVPYSDPRFPNADFSHWKICKGDKFLPQHHNILQEITNDFGIEYIPKFYWQGANSYIPPHIDYGTQCSLNFVLSDDPAPVNVEGSEYTYTSAFLNTRLTHSVRTGDTPRLLLKLSSKTSLEKLVKKITKYTI